MDDEALVRRLSALGQDTRLAMYRVLAAAVGGVVTQRDLIQAVGIEQNAASYHLRPLVDAGLVSSERKGREVVYRTNPEETARLAAALLGLDAGRRPKA